MPSHININWEFRRDFIFHIQHRVLKSHNHCTLQCPCTKLYYQKRKNETILRLRLSLVSLLLDCNSPLPGKSQTYTTLSTIFSPVRSRRGLNLSNRIGSEANVVFAIPQLTSQKHSLIEFFQWLIKKEGLQGILTPLNGRPSDQKRKYAKINV